MIMPSVRRPKERIKQLEKQVDDDISYNAGCMIASGVSLARRPKTFDSAAEGARYPFGIVFPRNLTDQEMLLLMNYAVSIIASKEEDGNHENPC